MSLHRERLCHDLGSVVRKGARRYLMLRIPLLLVLGIALLGTTAYSQGTASIVGTVTDATGGVVPDAKITITNVDTGIVRTTETNATGSYSAPNLAIGRYNVKVGADGFKGYEQTGVTLNVKDTVRIDVALQVGDLAESVTVEANGLQVQSDTNEVSQTISDLQVSQLATNGRNVLQLTALVPGASSNMPDFDSPMAQNQNRTISFGGQRPDHNNWLINGGEAYDRGGGGIFIVSPSQDSLEEFKVMTSNYGADLGQSSGGMVTMVTKSGAKDYHGSAWEYMRNDKFDANPFFNNYNHRTKPELRYNMFGFNIGGPVPLGQEKKTFFFYNMEWRRLINGGAINASAVPRPLTTGDFSSLLPTASGGTCTGNNCVRLMVPATNDPKLIAKFAQYGLTPSAAGTPSYFPGNIIPSGLLDANAKAVLAAGLFPGPNTADGRWYTVNNNSTFFREETFRVDHQFGEKVSLFGSLIYDNGVQSQAPPLWAGGTYNTAGSTMSVPSWAGVVHAVYTISPTLLNEASFNYNGNNILITADGVWEQPSGYSVKTLFTPSANTQNKLPAINIGAPYNVGYTAGWWPWENTWRSYQWKDDVSWIHGTHNMKFGGSYMWTHKNQELQLNTAGTVNFGTVTGNSMGDFMLGLASSYSEPNIRDWVSISNNTISLYAMDDWRVSNRLTLNLGLRWEGLPHAYDTNNRASNFYPDRYDPAKAAVFLPSGALDTNGPGFETVAGIPLANTKFYMNGVGIAGRDGIPKGLVKQYWNTFAPRVGFAYDLTGKGKTILRAGTGLFYERLGGNEQYNMGPNAPFSFQSNPSTVYWADPATNYQTGLTASTAYFPSSMTTVAYDYNIPTAIQWSLGIQQQLRENAMLSVSYVGNENYHQSMGRHINTVKEDTTIRTQVCGATCGYSGTTLNPNLYRPYLGWGSIAPLEFGGTSNYNSLQASFRVTAFQGMTLNSSYTWSHTLDIIDGELFANISNPFNVRYDYGPAGWDRRHVAVTNFVYDIPFLKNQGLAGKILGGWVVSGIALFQTGTPFSIGGGPDNLGYGGGTSNRANLVAPVTYPKTREAWFSKASFAKPGPLQWGNLQRNYLRNPGRNNWNMSLFKQFHFTEQTGLEVRLETFNTFNHTQFSGVDASITSGTFGTVTSANSPRNLELGMRLFF